MSGPAFRNGDGPHGGDDGEPRVPYQREQPETRETAHRQPPAESHQPMPQLPHYDHRTLKSLLGAWALSVCSQDEALAVEVHLTDCATCADEALRLRDAVGLLHQEDSLDLDPLLRARVLEGCLGRRPARIPVPEWAGPFDAEAARLDALLRDLGDGYWKAPVELKWHDGEQRSTEFTVAQVIGHLTAVDSLIARSLGLPPDGGDPSADPPRSGLGGLGLGIGMGIASRARLRNARTMGDFPLTPVERTAAHWATHSMLPGATVRSLWREQSHSLVRTVSFAGGGAGGLDVDYGSFALPLEDAFLDRAFECWIHASDIAEAVDYPYDPPAPRNLNRIIDLAARLLPEALADRRRAGLTTSPTHLVTAGTPGRSLLLEVEGKGGGQWYLPLDSPGAVASAEEMVAHVAMDCVEFCQLAAGHIEPERIAVGQIGDRDVIRDVLFATASLSRL
ncbi:maleylpyruvate isomerase N-terminal domain-containing protein [Streptomyces sp. NPDC008317]|uniref:maleylpyruvate isomerase N-terminal domain-containing protein n=1 Tax=Streptomyces sp. NPDC008317 TaxID=3364827 RepID=UPI0036E05A67